MKGFLISATALLALLVVAPSSAFASGYMMNPMHYGNNGYGYSYPSYNNYNYQYYSYPQYQQYQTYYPQQTYQDQWYWNTNYYNYNNPRPPGYYLWGRNCWINPSGYQQLWYPAY